MKIMNKIGSITLIILLSGCFTKKENQSNVEEDITFSVMSFNVLYSTSVTSTYKTIAETDADIVGLQEASEKRIKAVADSLGYYYHSFNKTTSNLSNDDTGILSRYKIIGTYKNGVLIKLTDSVSIAVFSVHLSPYPYEPYDLRDLKMETSEQVVASAEKTRIPEIRPVLHTIDSLINNGTVVFLTGDFNEPSHLDWTENAAASGLHFTKIVEWPCSKAVIDLKMQDSYRSHSTSEVGKPGITWTTNKSNNEVYDRIDFVYHHLQNKFEQVESMRVGRPDNEASNSVSEYESDHFAVLSSYKAKK